MSPEDQKAKAREYYLRNREKIIARAKAHYGVNKEKKKEYDTEYRKANRGKINAVIRDWRDRNRESQKAKAAEKRKLDPEKYAAIGRAWREANKEHLKKFEANRRKTPEREALQKRASKAWKKDNPDVVRNHVRNRRAKLRDGGVLSKGIEKKLMALQKGLCPVCHKSISDGFHLDHVIPVARGGENIDSNVQLLCPTCNHKKGAKHSVDFMQSQGFLL